MDTATAENESIHLEKKIINNSVKIKYVKVSIHTGAKSVGGPTSVRLMKYRNLLN